MVYHLLADLVEAGILGQIGDVTVHLTIHFDILHHGLAIGFQSTVEVVEVLDAADLTGCCVEEFRGQRLRNRVVALLLIAAHQIIALLLDHPIQLGNLIGRVLKVGIHRNDHVALGLFETTIQGRTLAVVTTELDALHTVRLGCQVIDHLPRLVGRAVVHENHLITETVGLHHPFYPAIQFRQRFCLIIKRYYY